MKVLGLPLTDFLAMYAAVVGTLGLIVSATLAIREIVKDRRSIEVNCEIDIIGKFDSLWEAVNVRATNVGFRPITLLTIGVGVNTGNWLQRMISPHKHWKWIRWTDHEFGDSSELPLTLADSKSFTYRFRASTWGFQTLTLQEIPKLRAFVRDSQDKYHTDRVPDDFLKEIYSTQVKRLNEREMGLG